MKRFFSAFILLTVALLTAFAADPLNFTSKAHDFGTIKEEAGAVSYDFEYVNKGDKPVAIISATTQCGCTKPTFQRKPINPGEKGTVKVTYNPDRRPGEFIKEVKLKVRLAGAPKSTIMVLKITGNVLPKSR